MTEKLTITQPGWQWAVHAESVRGVPRHELRVVSPAEWGQGAPIYPSMTWTRDAVRSGREWLGE